MTTTETRELLEFVAGLKLRHTPTISSLVVESYYVFLKNISKQSVTNNMAKLKSLNEWPSANDLAHLLRELHIHKPETIKVLPREDAVKKVIELKKILETNHAKENKYV